MRRGDTFENLKDPSLNTLGAGPWFEAAAGKRLCRKLAFPPSVSGFDQLSKSIQGKRYK
jgi:hypothetical protein